MSRKTKKRMAPKLVTAKNEINWSELDNHRQVIIENVANQSIFVKEFLEDPMVANFVDNDKESQIIVEGFGKDIVRTADELNRISTEHSTFSGKVKDHKEYVRMVQLFEEYNETALKFDHSLQIVVTELNSNIARSTAIQAKESGNLILHDEIMTSGVIDNAIDVTPPESVEPIQPQPKVEEKA